MNEVLWRTIYPFYMIEFLFHKLMIEYQNITLKIKLESKNLDHKFGDIHYQG